MDINKNNYELFFINYLEGQLSQEELADLRAFLLINPDLRDELEEMEELTAFAIDNSTPQNFDNKEFLHKTIADKKNITENNIDEFLIAYLEKDLDNSNSRRLETFLKDNPAFYKNLELLQKTFVKPDLGIKYVDKAKLKRFVIVKNNNIRQLYFAAASIAAVALLLFTVFIEYSPTNEHLYGEKAGREKILTGTISLLDKKSPESISSNHTQTLEFQSPLYKRESSAVPHPMDKKSQTNLESNTHYYLAAENRNEFSDIYHYIKLSELNQIEEDYSDVMPEAPSQGFLRYTAAKLFAGDNSQKNKNEGVPILHNAIDIGAYGINSLAKRDIINVQIDEADNKRSINLALGNNFSFSRR